MDPEKIAEELEKAKRIAEKAESLGFSKEYCAGFIAGLNYALKMLEGM